MTLALGQILQPVLLRVCLALSGLSSVLRSRMEVSSPPTSFDQLADTAFLLQSGTDPSSLPHFPALLLPFHKITGGGILPAVFFGAIADAISGAALYHLTLQQTQSTKNAVDVATMFLWNPLTIASCISGSTDSLRLCALFLAAACAAAGKSGLSGGCLALVLHFSTPCLFSLFSSPVMLMAIPLVAGSFLNNSSTSTKLKPTTGSPPTPRQVV